MPKANQRLLYWVLPVPAIPNGKNSRKKRLAKMNIFSMFLKKKVGLLKTS
jgi:hypothetical protein